VKNGSFLNKNKWRSPVKLRHPTTKSNLRQIFTLILLLKNFSPISYTLELNPLWIHLAVYSACHTKEPLYF